MLPAYKVKPKDLMEILYAISQTAPNSTAEDIEEFTNFSSRKVHEGLKLIKELEMVEGEESFSVKPSYRKKIDDVKIEHRDVLLNRALIQYRPFRTFGSYLRKGYPVENAAKKTNVVHDIASDPEYIIDYFERLGEYAGIVSTSGDTLELEIEGREIPVDSVESVDALRRALESEAEIRFWMEETIGSEIIAQIDEDTEDDLVKAFSEHAETPRDSITASGRALEDFLREIGRSQGADTEELVSDAGAGQVGDTLSGESIVREIHVNRVHGLAAIRNKGGAHGDDRQTGDRWKAEPEVALSAAMATTLLIASISEHVRNGNQIL